MNNEERYIEYKNNYNNIWLRHFIWNGLYGDTPQNHISIVNFVKETDIFNNIEKFHNVNEYNKYCSVGCTNKDIIKQKHQTDTLLLHYGVMNPAKSDIIKQKIINTQKNTPNFWRNIVQKRQKTCLKKYGVLNYTQTDIFREKFKQTCIKKYGVTNPLKSDIIKEKIKQTCLTRYNCSNGGMSSKAIGTFKLHKTFNSSSAERKSYQLIKDLYENTIYQYTSEEYPYMRDFYILELNLYIEYQGSMFHNMHLFRDTEEDNKQLDNIKMKAQESGRIN